MKHCKNERPLNLVIGFGKINFKKDGLLLGVSSTFHTFPNKNDIVQNVSRLDKTHLFRANNLRKKMEDSERESLGNDLVRDIQQGDGPPITDIFRVTHIRYEIDIPTLDMNLILSKE